MPLKRSTLLVLSTIAVTFLGVSYITSTHYHPAGFYITQRFSETKSLLSKSFFGCTTTKMSESLEGFLKRADPYPHARTAFRPSRRALELVALRSTPVEPSGFSLALFSSDSHSPSSSPPPTSEAEEARWYAVDSLGQIHVLLPTDVQRLKTHLIPGLTALPKPSRWQNTWEVAQQRTSQPIDRILVPLNRPLAPAPKSDYEDEFDEVGVQGFDGQQRELKESVGEWSEVPGVLWELEGAVAEGRAEREAGRERDGEGEGVVGYVRALVGPSAWL